MSKLGKMISDELSAFEWATLVPTDGSPVLSDDIRKWYIHTQAKAIWQFVMDNYSITLLANGTFINNTNFPTPPALPGTPYPQPTVGVSIEGWLAIPSHKKLFDAMMPWSKIDRDDPAKNTVDTFQRIFRDWLGILEVVAGQDTQVALPLVIPPAPNVAPPYFHSVNGSTLTANRFIPPREGPNPSNYPVACPTVAGGGMVAPAPDTGIPDAIVAETARWEGLRAMSATDEVTAYTEWVSTIPSGTTDETALEALRQPFRDKWKVKLEALRAEQKTLRGSETPDTARLTAIDSEITAIHSDCLDKIDQTVPPTATNPNPNPPTIKVYKDPSYPACTARVELCAYEKGLAEQGGATPPVAVKPPEVDAGTTDPDAPEVGVCATVEPNPPDYEFPATPAWYQVRPSVTFPAFETHARNCYVDIVASAPKNPEEFWAIMGKYIALCLNDNLRTAGGGSGYAYGLNTNPWQGTILVPTLTWNDA